MPDAGRSKIFKNASWMALGTVVNNGSNFIVFIVLARFLGATEFGVFSYVFSVAALFTMLGQMGLDGLLSRELLEEPDAQPDILGTAAVMRGAGYLAGALLTVAYGYIIPEHTPLEQELFLLAGIFVLMNALHAIPQNWLRSMHEAQSAAKAWMVGTLVGSAAKIVVVVLGGTLLAVGVAHLLGLAVTAAALLSWFYTKNGPKIRTWTVNWARARKLLRESSWLFASAMLWVIYMRIDVTLLRLLGSAEMVGQYAAASRMVQMSFAVPSALIVATFPAIMSAKQRCDDEYQEKLKRLFEVLAFCALLVVVLIWTFSKFFLVILLGDEFAASTTVLNIYALAIPFIYFHYAVARWIIIERKTSFGLLVDAIAVCLSLTLNFFLIPAFGPVGSAMSAVITYMFLGMISLVFLKEKGGFLIATQVASILNPWRGFQTIWRRLPQKGKL